LENHWPKDKVPILSDRWRRCTFISHFRTSFYSQEPETILFKENFSDFPGQLLISVQQRALSSNVGKVEQKEIDIKKMFLEPKFEDKISARRWRFS